MSVTHYLSIVFSRQRWRSALWFGLLLHGFLGVFALGKEIMEGFNLSFLINSVQFALVQGALILLVITTSKQEKQRYSLDTRFYLTCYKSERHRFLALKRNALGNVQALIGISQDELPEHQQDRLATRKDLMVSQSVFEWLPCTALKITDIQFELMDEWYELPWVINDQGLDTILKRFNAIDRYDYNGLTLAVHDWHAQPEQFSIRFKKSFYYNYLATNMLPEMQLPGGLTYRSLLEPGPSLSTLNTALPENHLGLSCLIRTNDGGLIIPRRSQHTNVFKGQLSPSVSGVANLGTCRNAEGAYTALAWLLQELSEELPFLYNAPDIFAEPLHNIASQALFLGMTRELRRCGKPEVFFFLPLEVSTEQVLSLWDKSTNSGSIQTLNSLHGIDHNENSGLLVVDEEELFSRIRPHSIVRNKKMLKRDNAELSVVLPAKEQADILSESLLANLILYQYHLQNTPVAEPAV